MATLEATDAHASAGGHDVMKQLAAELRSLAEHMITRSQTIIRMAEPLLNGSPQTNGSDLNHAATGELASESSHTASVVARLRASKAYREMTNKGMAAGRDWANGRATEAELRRLDHFDFRRYFSPGDRPILSIVYSIFRPEDSARKVPKEVIAVLEKDFWELNARIASFHDGVVNDDFFRGFLAGVKTVWDEVKADVDA